MKIRRTFPISAVIEQFHLYAHTYKSNYDWGVSGQYTTIEKKIVQIFRGKSLLENPMSTSYTIRAHAQEV